MSPLARTVSIAIVVTLTFATGCGTAGERGGDSAGASDSVTQADTAVDSPTEANLVVRPDDPEARLWLGQGDDKVTLAGNRFDSTVDAAQFVAMLYAEGAEHVVIASETIRPERDGHLADAIRVVLPSDAEQRQRLFRVLNDEAADAGFEPVPDSGQQVYYMWWD